VFSQKIGIPLALSQVKHGADLMAQAFTDDPFFTFTIPDTIRRACILPWLFEKTIHYGLLYGKVYTTSSMDGIAMWLGQKNPELTLMGILRTGLFLLPLKLRWREFQRNVSLANYVNQLHKLSVTGQHWYLFGLGVDPSRQGQGIGRVLMEPVLEQADQESLVCYLDTNNERNIPFYEKNGFTLANHGQGQHTFPHTWTMLREPR
jgi:ribosomal protein S18 acetylase RimI-like enzyme